MILDNVQSIESFKEIDDFLQENNFSKIGILVDENTLKDCFPLILPFLPSHSILEIKSGEEEKNFYTCIKIWKWMTHEQFDRKALLINLGGGVIGDMGGFCAATFKRGVRFINIPTTLLSQVDASVGGKLGIDFEGFKNHIGLFQEPVKVFINPVFLNTLPENELRSGFAEVLKHGLILDKNYWEAVKSVDYKNAEWKKIIEHSVKIKNKVVKEDPTEKGIRKILNFGHTLGHAIETFYLNTSKRLLHGEAIAIGMICEAYLSFKKLNLKESDLNDITNHLIGIYSKNDIAESDYQKIISFCLQDKKNSDHKTMFVLLEEPGKAIFDIPINEDDMIEALDFYKTTKG
jgi:3-dehydroquinate synthase